MVLLSEYPARIPFFLSLFQVRYGKFFFQAAVKSPTTVLCNLFYMALVSSIAKPSFLCALPCEKSEINVCLV